MMTSPPGNRLSRSILTLLAAFSPSLAAAQSTVSATSGDPAAIAQIRTRFTAVERDSSIYRRTRHDLHNFSLEGGELEGLFRGKELRKLDARFYGEIWRSREQYYFWGDSLFFAYAAVEVYDQPMSGNVRVTIEKRYYFQNDRLIRQVVTKRPRTAEYTDPWAKPKSEAELLTQARMLRACAAAESSDPPECSAPER